MKRAAFVLVLLVTVATPVYAVRITSVDDVIRMHRGGSSDEVIVAALQRLTERLEVAPDDVIAMRDAGLSDRVIEAVLAVAKPLPEPEKLEPVAETPVRDQTEPEEEPAEDECVSYDPPLFLFPPGWIVPRWLWDPNWFMPRLYKPSPAAAQQAAARAARPGSAASHPQAAPPRSEPRPATGSVAQPDRSSARPPIEQAGGGALGPRPRG